jgi:hypothetical protein
MACTGRYASATEYEALLCAGLDLTDPAVVTMVENYLDVAAADVHAALAAVGACSCTLAGWAVTFLKKLNIIDAAVIQNCPCGNTLTNEQKQMFLEWLNGQFELIRQGKIVVCEGETGSEYPAFGTVEIGWTEWSVAQIISNANQRLP